jgi:hypothetical protein
LLDQGFNRKNSITPYDGSPVSKSIFPLMLLAALLVACSTPADTEPAQSPPLDLTPVTSSPNQPVDVSPPPTPFATPFPFPTASEEPTSGKERIPSPDGLLTAVLDRVAGSLDIASAPGEQVPVFPPGSNVSGAKWSPDSLHLAVASRELPEGEAAGEASIPEIWLVNFEEGAWTEPELIYRAENSTNQIAAPNDIILGAWSPGGSHLSFWTNPISSASIQVDGLPLWCLELENSQATRLSDAVLVNPAYQSWAPDGSALVFTDGGSRSAQVRKWLSLYQVASGQTTTLVPESDLVPGQVAWSPVGEAVAFAAVEASQTGDEWADWMSWENPAILARRIYLLDPQTREYQRLNADESYQDAPRWSADGKMLYYVQADGGQAELMQADPATGVARSLPDCQMPLPEVAGFYGQVDWTSLHTDCNGKAGATLTGQVVAGYGDHNPIASLPLRVRRSGKESWDTSTDGEGRFTLTHVPVGQTYIDDSHLTFQTIIDSPVQSIDLGKLKYPLIHPPDYYWWQAAPVADLKELFDHGVSIDFTVCASDSTWIRPSPEIQRTQVYNQPPFVGLDHKTIERFERLALLYDTIDVAQQSFPGGLNLDEPGVDWLYLSGLWAASKNPLQHSNCSYSPADLQFLFDRNQLEVWLFGYKASKVQELDKENIEFAAGALCDPNDRRCTIRPGDHYAVQVQPAAGYQIIRFSGKPEVLAVQIVESGKELLTLP